MEKWIKWNFDISEKKYRIFFTNLIRDWEFCFGQMQPNPSMDNTLAATYVWKKCTTPMEIPFMGSLSPGLKTVLFRKENQTIHSIFNCLSNSYFGVIIHSKIFDQQLLHVRYTEFQNILWIGNRYKLLNVMRSVILSLVMNKLWL